MPAIQPARVPVPRASQLDAGRLDDEIAQLICERLRQSLVPVGSLLRLAPSASQRRSSDATDTRYRGTDEARPAADTAAAGASWAGRWSPEITLLVDGLMFALGVGASGASHGEAMQQLKLSDASAAAAGPARLSRSKTLLFGFVSVFGKWLWTRFAIAVQAGSLASFDISAHDETLGGSSAPSSAEAAAARIRPWRQFLANVFRSRALAEILERSENMFRIISVLNLLVFFHDGRYPTLLHRVLQLRLVRSAPPMQSAVSYEYMNRQLVWQGFTEFLMFAVPLVSSAVVRRWTSRIVNHASRLKRLAQPGAMAEQKTIPGENWTSRVCPVCDTDPPTVPHVSECGHVFCYWCIARGLADDAYFACPHCRTPVGKLVRATAEDMNQRR